MWTSQCVLGKQWKKGNKTKVRWAWRGVKAGSSCLGGLAQLVVCLHVCTFVEFVCSVLHILAAAPCQYAGRAHVNPTQLRFEYTIFQKLPLTKSDPSQSSIFCYHCVSFFSRLVKTSLETITSRISRTMVYTQVSFIWLRAKFDSKSSTSEGCVCLASPKYFIHRIFQRKCFKQNKTTLICCFTC